MTMAPTAGRRAFITGGIALSLLPSVVKRRVAAASSTRPSVPDSAWNALAMKVKGGVLRPGDSGFDALRRPANLRYDSIVPLGIARPRDAVETIASIAWSREVGIPMVLHSGGHSYAGCSTVVGLVIHTGLMRGVRHLGGDAVEVEGGALNTDLYRVLASIQATAVDDGLSVTHGRCAGVGASAFLLGGGIGFAMRDRGLGCDCVEEVDVALPDGRVVRASNQENVDLFWALRGGGGGNLGVALRFKLRAVKAEPVTTFNFVWERNVEQVFLRLVRALEVAPDRMGTKVTVAATRKGEDRPNAVTLLGSLRGPSDDAQTILAPVLAIAEPRTRSMQTTSYWQGQKSLSVAGEPSRYQETSRYCGTLRDQVIEEVFRRCRDWPGTQADASFKMFHVGGRISEIPPSDTAYVHRDAIWLTGTDMYWTDRDTPDVVSDNLAWQREFHNACAALMPEGGSYQNFPDPGLADPAAAYYGTNLARLLKIKHQIDPDGVFTPPRRQGIGG